MDLKNIIIISGKPGLYSIIANNKNNIIVEALKDKRRFPAFASYKISSLEEISIYADNTDIPLKEVFVKLYNHLDKKSVDKEIIKDNAQLISLFEEFLPDYDKDLVYPSHMKKVCQWYNELLEHDLIDDKIEEEKTKEEEKTEGNK